ncbi:MAG TPA: sugar-binding domain-containing protein [Candidatus Paceibacterota bacterium]|nr:sugar-binding domain-containing protein [Verrucomicrobiota bacterium]HRY46747.1 sugar-binding domain-containing protein [Candidatus Paceibacterota bacterium]
MSSLYSDDQLRLAARLYYLDGLSQTEVARFVKVSQAKISRLLALARTRGIVRISVEKYEPRHEALERRICQHFGLCSTAVIKILEGATVENARRTLGHFGSAFVSTLIPPGSVVAIAGGRTMRELVQAIPEETKSHLTVVQAMGSVDSTVGPVDAFELGHTLARRWGGSFFMLNTPAFVPDRKTRDSFLALPQIGSVWQRLDQVSVALVGIGTLENSVFAERGVLGAADLGQLKRRGAVGEICGRFYDSQGRECDSPWRDRVISISLDQLRLVPQVVGIVAGADRSSAIIAAIRGGLLKSLIIDEASAIALLSADVRPAKRIGSIKMKS